MLKFNVEVRYYKRIANEQGTIFEDDTWKCYYDFIPTVDRIYSIAQNIGFSYGRQLLILDIFGGSILDH